MQLVAAVTEMWDVLVDAIITLQFYNLTSSMRFASDDGATTGKHVREMYTPLNLTSKTGVCRGILTYFSYTLLRYAGVYLFFLLLLQNIDCGYSLEPPRRGGSNVYPQSMF